MVRVSAQLKLLGQQDDHAETVLADPKLARYLRPPQVGKLAAGQCGFGSSEVALEDSAKIWVADEKLGFKLGAVVKRNADKCTLIISVLGAEGVMVEETVAENKTQSVNPVAFDLSEDMATLTHLNEASVLHNLADRFKLDLIHTYSGLFCVTINPWRWLPLYSKEIMLLYKGQQKQRWPPHVYAIGYNAYDNLLQGHGDQAILITGESGAGKTENTKKIIQYFTLIAGHKAKAGDTSLEDAIIEMNPALEAFGNAKTTQNDNSSRFGKFIRVRFDANGRVCGAQVETYLLEKSRVISQNPGERSFHIFYQMLSDGMPKAIRECLKMTRNPSDYRFINQGGSSEVASLDDAEEMRHTDMVCAHSAEGNLYPYNCPNQILRVFHKPFTMSSIQRALDTLGFSADDKLALYQLVAGTLLMGEMKFSERPGMDVTFVEGMDAPNDVGSLLGIQAKKFVDALTEPTVKVGGELVRKSHNLEKTMFYVSAVAKTVYDKTFVWMVALSNKTLAGKTVKVSASSRQNYIGVLDIAGFEILGRNSFEQLCINFTNERLQQFFNHFMFVREQSEYEQEQISWDYIDFGLDLQASIDLIEKPMGILSMLEEECMMPKGSDMGFVQKLETTLVGKNDMIGKPKRSKKSISVGHFSIAHYAGTVNYNADGWLDKNKDPMNDGLLEVFQKSRSKLVASLFAAAPQAEEASKKPGKKRKSLSFMTVSMVYKVYYGAVLQEQLSNLMATLNSTTPHFIRCIVPNYEREPGVLTGPLVLSQLSCNGVLEGIRICRRGYPNRLLFHEIVQRYRLFAPEAVDATSDDARVGCEAICKAMDLEDITQYQFGLTKLFCRVGVIGLLETRRNDRIAANITGFQAHIRSFSKLIERKRLYNEWQARLKLQANVKHWIGVRSWEWFRLMLKVLPLIERTKEDEEAKKRKEEEFAEMLAKLEQFEKDNAALRAQVESLEERLQAVTDRSKAQDIELAGLKDDMAQQQTLVSDLRRTVQKHELDIAELTQALTEERSKLRQLGSANEQLQTELSATNRTAQMEAHARRSLEESDKQREMELRKLQADMKDEKLAKQELATSLNSKEHECTQVASKLQFCQRQLDTLQQSASETSLRLEETETQLKEERALRRRAEKTRTNLEDDFDDLTDKYTNSQRENVTLREDIRRKEVDMARIEADFQAANERREQLVDEVKRKNNSVNKQMGTQLEEQRSKAIKLEAENRQLRCRLAAEQADAGRPPAFISQRRPRRSGSIVADAMEAQASMEQSLTSSRNMLRRSSSQSDFFTRRVETLEKESRDAQAEKRMLKRQIDVYKQSLTEESAENCALTKQLRALRSDSERLSHDLTSEETQNADLVAQLRKAQSDALHWKTKCEKTQLATESELDSEKQKMKLRLYEASMETKSKQTHLMRVEKTYKELQEELKDAQVELERTNSAGLAMERLQRSQEKTLNILNEQQKRFTEEIDALRAENMALRSKLRNSHKDAFSDYDSVTRDAEALFGEISSLSQRDELLSPTESDTNTTISTGSGSAGRQQYED